VKRPNSARRKCIVVKNFQSAELDEVLIVVVSKAEVPPPLEGAVLNRAHLLMDGFGSPYENHARTPTQHVVFVLNVFPYSNRPRRRFHLLSIFLTQHVDDNL
jgi:hypothetical protein